MSPILYKNQQEYIKQAEASAAWLRDTVLRLHEEKRDIERKLCVLKFIYDEGLRVRDEETEDLRGACINLGFLLVLLLLITIAVSTAAFLKRG